MHASLDSRKPHHVGGASTVSATGSDSVSAALADRTWPDRMRTGFASALRTARDLAGLVTGCPRMCGQENVTLRQPPEGSGLGSDVTARSPAAPPRTSSTWSNASGKHSTGPTPWSCRDAGASPARVNARYGASPARAGDCGHEEKCRRSRRSQYQPNAERLTWSEPAQRRIWYAIRSC